MTAHAVLNNNDNNNSNDNNGYFQTPIHKSSKRFTRTWRGRGDGVAKIITQILLSNSAYTYTHRLCHNCCTHTLPPLSPFLSLSLSSTEREREREREREQIRLMWANRILGDNQVCPWTTGAADQSHYEQWSNLSSNEAVVPRDPHVVFRVTRFSSLLFRRLNVRVLLDVSILGLDSNCSRLGRLWTDVKLALERCFRAVRRACYV